MSKRTYQTIDLDNIPTPTRHEKCAISYVYPFKKNALLFDRLWIGHFLKSYVDHYFHTRTMVGRKLSKDLFEVPNEVVFSIREYDLQAERKAIPPGIKIKSKKNFSYLDIPFNSLLSRLRLAILRNYAETYIGHGFDVTPLYDNIYEYSNEFIEGDTLVFEATLHNIGVAEEKELVWEQVLEFRNDNDAKSKYRALRTWLSSSVQANTITEAADIIGKKLDDYEWVIKKHGLKTITGALTDVFDSKTLAAILAGGGIAGLIGGPVWSAIAGGALALGKFTVSLLERRIDLEDIKRTNAEVALIYEAREKFRKKES